MLIGRVECANCCHGIVEMTRTGFRNPCFFSYSLQRTSHDLENNRKMILTKESVTTQEMCNINCVLCYRNFRLQYLKIVFFVVFF